MSNSGKITTGSTPRLMADGKKLVINNDPVYTRCMNCGKVYKLTKLQEHMESCSNSRTST